MCPDDIVREIPPSQEGIIVVWKEPKVVDNSGNVSLFLQSHQSGSLFGFGETEIVYLWQDEAKNTAECRFQIQIVEGYQTTMKTIVGTNGNSSQNSQISSTLIVVLLSTVAMLLVAIFVGVIIGKCVKCQCKTGNEDHFLQPNAYTTNMQINKGVHYISPAQASHPLPPPGQPSAPPVYTHYVVGNDSTPSPNVSSIYLEITSDPPEYSHFLQEGTQSEVEPPPPPYRPQVTQIASE